MPHKHFFSRVETWVANFWKHDHQINDTCTPVRQMLFSLLTSVTNVIPYVALRPLCRRHCSAAVARVDLCIVCHAVPSTLPAPVQPVRLSATGPLTGPASWPVCQYRLACVCPCPPVAWMWGKSRPALRQTASYFHWQLLVISVILLCFGDIKNSNSTSRSNFKGACRSGTRPHTRR